SSPFRVFLMSLTPFLPVHRVGWPEGPKYRRNTHTFSFRDICPNEFPLAAKLTKNRSQLLAKMDTPYCEGLPFSPLSFFQPLRRSSPGLTKVRPRLNPGKLYKPLNIEIKFIILDLPSGWKNKDDPGMLETPPERYRSRSRTGGRSESLELSGHSL
ncbi:7111_t:CDS:2, partial [Funneliformis geosporum]